MSEIVPQIRQQGLMRFDFLGGCLPGKANPTDIDQVIERNGHFLFIECKRPNQAILMGQKITFDRLTALSDRVRLLVVVGHPPDKIESYGWWGKPQQSSNVNEVRALVRRWYDWAGDQRDVA